MEEELLHEDDVLSEEAIINSQSTDKKFLEIGLLHLIRLKTIYKILNSNRR